MKISVASNTLTDNGQLTPVDPIPPKDIDDSFALDVFSTSKTTFTPFEEVEIEWLIKAKDPDTDFSDYIFTLNASDTILADELEASGRKTFSPNKNTLLTIWGRRRSGGGKSSFEKKVALTVDESDCLTIAIYKPLIDDEVKNKLSNFTSETAEIRLRKKPILVNQNPKQYILKDMEVTSTWNHFSIEYFFPLEIVINNFFNADLDVTLDISLKVEHNNSDTVLDVNINHSSDADFSTGEDIFSIGIASAVAKTIDKLLPLILDCELDHLEQTIVRTILGFLNPHLDTHRLLDIRIVVSSQSLTGLYFVLCPLPVEPEPDGPLAPGDDTHHL